MGNFHSFHQLQRTTCINRTFLAPWAIHKNCLFAVPRPTHYFTPTEKFIEIWRFFSHIFIGKSLYDSMLVLILNITLTIIQMFYLTAENRSLTTRHWIHEDYLTSQVYKKKSPTYRPTLRILGRLQQTKIFLRMVLWCQQIKVVVQKFLWADCFFFFVFFFNKINDPSVQVH